MTVIIAQPERWLFGGVDLSTFATVVAFGIACVAPVIGLAVLVNRADKPPVRW